MADTPPAPLPQQDPELAAKEREAKLADAEAKRLEALKKAAEYKKASDEAADPELLKAQREKAKAEAEKAKAEANKAKLAAELPSATSKPLAGDISVDDKTGFFAEVLAFESAKQNAAAIAAAIGSDLENTKRLYLVSEPSLLKGAFQLSDIERRLRAFSVLLDRAMAESEAPNTQLLGPAAAAAAIPALGALAAVPALVATIADIAAFFRADRTIKGRQTGVTDEALALEVARVLSENAKHVQIVRPALMLQVTSKIQDAIAQVNTKANDANLRAAEIRASVATLANGIEAQQLQVARIQADLDRLAGGAEDQRTKVEGMLRAAQDDLLARRNEKGKGENTILLLTSVTQACTELTNKLLAVPDGATTSPLASLAEIALLRDDADALFLSVSVVGQGGEVEARKRLFGSGEVYHRAGTACAYQLFARDGVLKKSGVVVADVQAKDGKRFTG